MRKVFSSLMASACLSVPLLASGAAYGEPQGRAFPSIIFFDVDQQKQTAMVPKSRKKEKSREQKSGKQNLVGAVHVVDQPLGEFLVLAGKQFGVEIDTVHHIRSNIRNMKLSGDLDSMLDQLSAQFGFVWYRENDVVRVSAKDKALSKMIFLGSMQYQEFVSNLNQAGLSDRSIDIQHIPSSNSVLANGPASLIARMELVADGYNKNANGVSVIGYGKKR